MKAENELVSFRCKDLTLEGIVTWPAKQKTEGLSSSSKASGALWGGIVCHPHPLYGGNMYNDVVVTAWEAFVESGLVALRFNFRGTGRSQGRHSGGVQEQEDVEAAIDYLLSQDEGQGKGIALAGYSFGAMVGLRVAVKDPRVVALIAIAPPLSMDDFSFLENCPKPQLIIAGENDFICPKALAGNLYHCLSGPKRIALIPQADHSLFGGETQVSRTIKDFIHSYGDLLNY
ncbi:MAG: alpha/beta fold hydrolase [Candidatus Tectomicrobia bacterium]|uniref:Alpha/beta fold hydrolase n=1 Tax=Tectimicrobiota bacterium TaxID=2528274 RepID=A0A933GLC2_UNCTE|nr:alpha/beta fold hydrolase [Candidatus Tectomicrobia bacterium]